MSYSDRHRPPCWRSSAPAPITAPADRGWLSSWSIIDQARGSSWPGSMFSDEPSFLTVRVGMISRHRLVFVAVAGAPVSPNAVRVQYSKKVVHSAPAIDTDGELAATAEPEVFAYYNFDYGSRSQRRLARR